MRRQPDRRTLALSVIRRRASSVAVVVGWSSVVAGAPAVRAADMAPPTVRAGDGPPTAVHSRPITGWVAGGLGTAGIGSQDGDAARVELAMATGMHLFSLRYTFAADTNGSCGDLICLGNNVLLPHNSVNEIALQYGVKGRAPFVLGTASAGIAALWTVQRGDTLLSMACFFGCAYQYNSIAGHTVGATAELGGYLTSRYVSIGPTFILDVNSIQSFWSLLVDVHFGWMGEAH